jgi:general secretion pathway protein G
MNQPISPEREKEQQSKCEPLWLRVILIVIIILIGVAVFTPRIGRGPARLNATQIQTETIAQAIEVFHADAGRYPAEAEGLDALIDRPADVNLDRWHGPYLKHGLPLDGWGHPFQYRYPSQHGKLFDVNSGGPDRLIGTVDDLAN